MCSTSASPAGTLWTIGHSNHPLEAFLDLLAQHHIELLVDVRSSPYSGYASQFNREAISPALRQRAVAYRFLGDRLGGRTDDPRYYDEQGPRPLRPTCRVGRLPPGDRAVAREIARGRVAILCGEEDPTDCHRRLLVGRVRGQRGVQVVHIRGDGRLQTEGEVAAELQFRKPGAS